MTVSLATAKEVSSCIFARKEEERQPLKVFGKDVVTLLSSGFGKSFAKHRGMKWVGDTPRHATNRKPQNVDNQRKWQ